MNLDEIIIELKKNATIHNKEFAESLIPNATKILGVKVPILREIAKNIAKEDAFIFLEQNDFSYYELEMLHGMVIGYMKCDITSRLNQLDLFLPHIHDWSVCDTLCSTFKVAKKYQDIFWDYLINLATKKDEFILRVVVVMMMCYYLNDEYIDKVINYCNILKHNGYYFKMGLAWLIATMMAKYPNECLELLKNNNIDDFTYNKAIQKMIESYRVDETMKEILKKMKRS